MLQEDEHVREELAASGELYRGYTARIEEIHQRHARELEAVVEQYGWPGKNLVGEDGAAAAWVLLQHAIGSPKLLRECLPLLKCQAEKGGIARTHAAFLEDRICFFERRPQRYGTQFDWNIKGELVPWVLAEPERVDEWRESVGLGPLADRAQQIRKQIGAKEPADFRQRQKEMRSWAKSVGWYSDCGFAKQGAVRPERSADAKAIREIHEAAFPTPGEAALVEALRDHDRLQLSLVFEAYGMVLGHIAFSPVEIAGATIGSGLGPLAVRPEWQGQGMGGRLVTEGLAACRDAGRSYVVVLGEPSYYGRFGFVAASRWNLSNEYGAGDQFMILELRPGSIPSSGGLVRYGPEFDLVT
jgi:predicted N-acetyltransferase YhbS